MLTATSAAMGQFYIPEGTATVDGNLAEWSGATWIPMERIYTGDPVDLSQAKWAARWSDSANLIYVAVQGVDTYHWFYGSYQGWAAQDAVEFYIDASNSDSTTFKDNNWDKAQQYVGSSDGTPDGEWLTLAGNPLPAGTVSSFAVSVVGDTINYEIALMPYNVYNMADPASSTQVDLAAGTILGLDIVMNTRHGFGFGAKCQNTNSAKHRDASKFLDVTLVDASFQIGPVHLYTFNNDCNDSVGTAHGTLINNTGASVYLTDNGQTLLKLGNDGVRTNLPGDSDYVELPAGLISGLGVNKMTLELWLTCNSRAPAQAHFQFGTDYTGTSDSGHWLIGLRNNWNGRSTFQWKVGGAGSTLWTDDGGGQSFYNYPYLENAQIVLTYNGASSPYKAQMYVRGKKVKEIISFSPGLFPSLTSLQDPNNWLGRGFEDSGRGFEGAYNEFRIYNRVLTDGEILARNEEGPVPSGTMGPVTVPDPVHLYSFNRETSPVKDSAGTADGSVIITSSPSNSGWQQRLDPLGRDNGYYTLANNPAGQTSDLLNGGDYIALPAELIPGVGSSQLTFEFWLVPETISSYWMPFYMAFGEECDPSEVCPNCNPDWCSYAGKTSSLDYFMFFTPRNADWEWWFGWKSGVNQWGYLDESYVRVSPSMFQEGQEAQIVVTYDYAAMRSELYVNGVFQGGYFRQPELPNNNVFTGGYCSDEGYKWVDFATEWVGHDSKNWLGRAFEDSRPMAHVTFNEFRIYDTVLTEWQIRARYAAGPVPLGAEPPECIDSWDFDQDGDVDDNDLLVFESYAGGPGIPRLETFPAKCADFDDDGDVDQADFAVFQRCYSGEGIPFVPGCGQ